MRSITTKHNLAFEVRQGLSFMEYRVGTVTGQWGSCSDSFFILSFLNHEPGNGHLDDVFEWFYNSCKRDGKNLIILECMNDAFKKHLIAKRDFIPLGVDHLIKVYNKKSYKRLLRMGNEILDKNLNAL